MNGSPRSPAGLFPGGCARLPRLLWARALAMWLSLSIVGLGLAYAGQDLIDAAQIESRVRSLSAELSCVICDQNLLPEARAELRGDLVSEVRQLVGSGRTDAEVVAHLVARYGDFIRYRPAMNESLLVLWFGPALTLLLCLGWLARLCWRQRAGGDSSPVTTGLAPRRGSR